MWIAEPTANRQEAPGTEEISIARQPDISIITKVRPYVKTGIHIPAGCVQDTGQTSEVFKTSEVSVT
jgi:hypothetical protein